MATHLSIFAWKNSKDRGDWWAIVQEVAKELETTEWLNTSRSQYIDIMLLHFTKNCFKIYKTKFIQFKMLTERLIQHMATKQVTHKLTTPCLHPFAGRLRITVVWVSFYNILVLCILLYPTWSHLHILLFRNRLYSLSQVFTSYIISKEHIDLFFNLGLLNWKLLFPSGIILIQIQNLRHKTNSQYSFTQTSTYCMPGYKLSSKTEKTG